jgi:hypothetical protein
VRFFGESKFAILAGADFRKDGTVMYIAVIFRFIFIRV